MFSYQHQTIKHYTKQLWSCGSAKKQSTRVLFRRAFVWSCQPYLLILRHDEAQHDGVKGLGADTSMIKPGL